MVSFLLHRVQVVIIVILVVLGGVYAYSKSEGIRITDFFLPETPILHIRDVALRVELARTDDERIKGLSGRASLSGVDGMLFIFPESGYHTIWMKDMKFPIDIIWIDEHMQIIGIDKSVTPDTYPRLYRPSRPAKYVLETNINFADTYSFREGNEVSIAPKYLAE